MDQYHRDHASDKKAWFWQLSSQLYKFFEFFSLLFTFYYEKQSGQTTTARDNHCIEMNNEIEFSQSSLPHSEYQFVLNCSLAKCSLNSNGNNSCKSSSTPCFDYRSYDNNSYCAPGVLCDILETCNNITRSCANGVIGIVKSCCSPRAICLPLIATSFCPLGKESFLLKFWIIWSLKYFLFLVVLCLFHQSKLCNLADPRCWILVMSPFKSPDQSWTIEWHSS